MESQEGLGNAPRWEHMNKDILSNIFKKLSVVDVIMGASRVCITWFLASHNKTIWNTIKLNDLDSILFDNPYVPHMQDNDREKHRYHPRKILIEINKFGPTIPTNFFFNVYSNLVEEDLAIISKGMPNIRKLALPMWKTLNLNSIQAAFSEWKNLQTLIMAPFISLGDALSLELRAIGDNCRNLTNIKFLNRLDKDLASIIICNFPSLERLSFRCSYACIDAAISLINGLPNLKIFNLSHCIFTQSNKIGDNRVSIQPNGAIGKTFKILGMKPKENLVHPALKSLSDLWYVVRICTICQDVWEHSDNPKRQTLEFRYFREEQWKTDEIKEFEF